MSLFRQEMYNREQLLYLRWIKANVLNSLPNHFIWKVISLRMST